MRIEEVRHCGECASPYIEFNKEKGGLFCHDCNRVFPLKEIEIIGYNNPLYFIDLDTCGDIFMEGTVEIMIKNNIKFELLEWRGPGGQFPVIRYTGSMDALLELVTGSFCDEELIHSVKKLG